MSVNSPPRVGDGTVPGDAVGPQAHRVCLVQPEKVVRQPVEEMVLEIETHAKPVAKAGNGPKWLSEKPVLHHAKPDHMNQGQVQEDFLQSIGGAKPDGANCGLPESCRAPWEPCPLQRWYVSLFQKCHHAISLVSQFAHFITPQDHGTLGEESDALIMVSRKCGE